MVGRKRHRLAHKTREQRRVTRSPLNAGEVSISNNGEMNFDVQIKESL